MGRLCYPTQASGQDPGTLAEKAVTVQGGYGTFCRPGTNFIEHYACRGTSLIGAGIYPRLQNWGRALAQCRGTICLGARNCQGAGF